MEDVAPLGCSTEGRSCSRALRQARVSGLRFHDLRHEAVSRLVEAGLNDQEVVAISGHKSMQMLKRYTHLRAEDLVEKLDQVHRHCRLDPGPIHYPMKRERPPRG